LAFPSDEVGPVERWLLARLAASWFGDAIGRKPFAFRIRGDVKALGHGRAENIGFLACDRISLPVNFFQWRQAASASVVRAREASLAADHKRGHIAC
jgi:hypothetical protein